MEEIRVEGKGAFYKVKLQDGFIVNISSMKAQEAADELQIDIEFVVIIKAILKDAGTKKYMKWDNFICAIKQLLKYRSPEWIIGYIQDSPAYKLENIKELLEDLGIDEEESEY